MEGTFQINLNIQNKPVFKRLITVVSNYRKVSPLTNVSTISNSTVNEFFF
jgi:hypothetical protein